MKAAILTFYSGDPDFGVEPNRKKFNEVGGITASINRRYAERHGYDFICRTDDFPDIGRHFHFQKQRLILDYIDDYDWIFFLDGDAFITNHAIELEEYIDNRHDLLIGHGYRPHEGQEGSRLFNAGVFFIKNSDWSRNYLNAVLDHPRKDCDNPVMIDICKEWNAIQHGHVKIMPRKLFNSYNWERGCDWEKGDFVMHMVCSSNDFRMKILRDAERYITYELN